MYFMYLFIRVCMYYLWMSYRGKEEKYSLTVSDIRARVLQLVVSGLGYYIFVVSEQG